MTRFFCLLFLGALVLGPASRADPPKPPVEGEAVRQELNQFVQEAIRQGLLAPPAGAEGEEQLAVRPVPSGEAASPADHGTQSSGDEQATEVNYGSCALAYPLDFSEFSGLEQYSDMINFRTELLAEESSALSRQRLAKAYLSLDLGSEAVMSLGRPDSPEALALQKVAELIQNRRRPDVAYFQHLSECHEEGRFWLGAALLADGKAAGIAHLDNSFTEFRSLPLQLRTSVTSIVMPGLDATGAGFLSQKLLASFDKKLVRDSAQLQFANSVYELSQGSQEAEITLRTFLLKGRFQEEALFSLMRHDRDIDGSLKAVLLDNMILKIERAEHEEDVSESIKYVLEELREESRYLTMLEMASRPNMQGERVQDQIRTSFVEALERDLSGEDRLRNLAAIEALSVESGFLDYHEKRTRLYEQATLNAVRLGFVSLADLLSSKVYPGEDVYEHRAELAYRLKDYPGVFRLAQSYPKNPQIGLVAALSAISMGDQSQLQGFVSQLELTDETVLMLIEHDAAANSWILPERVYSAAASISDDEKRERAQRVIALRQTARGGVAAPAPASMAAVPERLMSARMVLEAMDSEGN